MEAVVVVLGVTMGTTEDITTGDWESVEHTVDVGRTEPLASGSGKGKVGFSALPTTFPSPGKLGAETAETAADFLAAWYRAALSLSLSRRAGPRRFKPPPWR